MPPKKPAAKPGARAAAKPAAKPGAKPAAKPTAKPAAAKTPAPKAEEKKEEVHEVPEVKVLTKELDRVLFRDEGDKIKNSGKWPLIIDTIGQAQTFIRYRDCNYIEALNQGQMEPERIRMAVLGSLRYGKPLVLDMMDFDLLEAATTRFDEVLPGLMQHIMDKSIMEDEVYEQMIRESDDPSYQAGHFAETFNFQFWIISTKASPSPDLLSKTYPIRMYVPE